MNDDRDDDFWESIKTESSDCELQAALDSAADDEVVCRECAVAFGQITEQHLRTHGKTLDDYRRDHPDAPTTPRASEQCPGTEEGCGHSEETRRKSSESMTGSEDA